MSRVSCGMTSFTNAEALTFKAVPEGLLPAADDSIVRARRAIPINTVVLVAGRIGDHDPGATPMLRPAAALHVRWIVDVGSGIDYDAGEVLGQEPSSRGHLGDGTGGTEIMPKIDDPGVTHDNALNYLQRTRCWNLHFPRAVSVEAARSKVEARERG